MVAIYLITNLHTVSVKLAALSVTTGGMVVVVSVVVVLSEYCIHSVSSSPGCACCACCSIIVTGQGLQIQAQWILEEPLVGDFSNLTPLIAGAPQSQPVETIRFYF